MELETEKFYRTRDGRKAGPMRFRLGATSAFRWSGNLPGVGEATWRKDGTFHCEAPECACADLVAEWVEPDPRPVRAVTRTEIITGVYGPINVTSVYPDGVNIYANTGKWSAADLRHAARSFVSMAEALEEK